MTANAQGASEILFDHGSYGLNFTNLSKITWQFDRHYQVLVGSEPDVNILRNVLIETSVANEEELSEVRVRVLRFGGPDTTFSLASFQQQPYDAETIDHLLQLDDLLVGDTIDVKYTILSKPSTNTQRWTVQYDFPVRESLVSYVIPEAFTYHANLTDQTYLTSNSTIDSTLRLRRGRIELTGVINKFENIPAYRVEPFAPPPIESKPAALFTLSDFSVAEYAAYLPSWSEQFIDLAVSDVFGKQYRTRSNYRWLLEEASELFTKRYADRLLLLKLYQFIHEQFNWDGSYGLIPSYGLADMRYEKTVNKAGMNMALLALLIEADFNAYPILVTTTDRPSVVRDIEDVNQFNHFVIEVNLGREKVYLDAGDGSLPLGWVDSGIRPTPVVRIQNLRGQWTELPPFTASSMTVINMNVSSDFSATGNIHISFTGYDAFSERLKLQDDRQAQYWKDRAASLSPNVRVDSVRFENVTNIMEPFINTVHFHLEGSLDSDELQVNPIFYSFFGGVYFADSIRQNAVELPFGITEQVVVNINLEPGMKAQFPSSLKLNLEGGDGSFEYAASETPQGMQSRFKATLAQTHFEASQYLGLKTFLDAAFQLTQKPIVIRKTS